jgi:phosphatidyl-myo-inositol dimannoside synthase
MKEKNINLWVPNLFEFKGGIQSYLYKVISVLNYLVFNINVSDKLDSQVPDEFQHNQNIVFTFSGSAPSFLRKLHFIFGLLEGVVKTSPQLILCAHTNFSPIAYFTHILTGIPYWLFVYGMESWDLRSKYQIKALRRADKIISISGYTRDRLLTEQKLDPAKVVLLPCTFDLERFQIAAKPVHLLEKFNLKPEQPVILTVARLDSVERYKGYDQILLALQQIRVVLPNVHYILVGQGNDRSRIETLIQRLNLQDCVTLAGFVRDEELGDYYNLCDVFAMPSKREGFGIVYLEALACGKPTLGGNQDGAIDALCHGSLGALVNPDDVTEIAQTLVQILQGTYANRLIYQPEALRQKVIEIYGFDEFKRKLIGHLEECFKSRASK